MQARGLSLRTVEHYSDVLNRVLGDYCRREGLQPAALDKRHLEHLTAELHQVGRYRQTVKTYVTAINTFLTWCHSEGELAELRAPRPSVERPMLDVLSRAEIQAWRTPRPRSATSS
jgi:site-specific recombinase XerD